MTSDAEIRETAEILGWKVSATQVRKDTFLLGQHMIAVDYKRDGSVDQAARYLFYRINDLHLEETLIGGRYKKAKVIGWLARFA